MLRNQVWFTVIVNLQLVKILEGCFKLFDWNVILSEIDNNCSFERLIHTISQRKDKKRGDKCRGRHIKQKFSFMVSNTEKMRQTKRPQWTVNKLKMGTDGGDMKWPRSVPSNKRNGGYFLKTCTRGKPSI